MRSFQFRLDALLKYRRILEEQANIKLAAANASYLTEQELLLVLKDSLGEHVVLMRKAQQKPVSVTTLKMLHYYHDKIYKDINQQEDRLNAAAIIRQQCIEALKETMKNRKVVEKLKEKSLLQHRTEMLQEEQKNLDEIGLQVFSRS